MSVLERDWRQLREDATAEEREEGAMRAEATAAADGADIDEPVAVERDAVGARATSGRGLIRRTVRRFT